MKTYAGIALMLILAVTPVDARETRDAGARPMQAVAEQEYDLFEIDQGLRGRFNAAQVDTYCIVWYDFESMEWQGWTRVDNTAQIDTFFHVDDFSGLGGGEKGLLCSIEGTRSMWCGTRPSDDEYLCRWVAAPGYGNQWEQFLVTEAFSFSGILTLSYHGVFDSEPDYDITSVQYDAGNEDWRDIISYDGIKDTVAVHSLQLTQTSTKLRFRFESDGAWSDQDGLYQSDGAAIIDSITVSDVGGVIDFEDFESWPLFAKSKPGAFWRAATEAGFGLYSGCLAGITVDKDPCGDNFGTQIVFFIGSPYPSSDYPGLYETPYCKGPGNIEAPCQYEFVVSPIIDMKKYSSNCDNVQDADIPTEKLPDLGGCYFHFTVYRDLPVANLVFYKWAVRNYDEEMCPEQWEDRTYVYYGDEQDYIISLNDISDLVGGNPIQVRLGCVDMCAAWYEVYGNCANHTPSPWFDNVRIQRFDVSGPQWSWRDLDIFQDNFPSVEFNLESFVRADCANDLRANDDPVIDPGDSAVVTCSSPLGGGIDTTVDGWPKVYCHVYPEYIGDPLSPKPALYGPTLEGTCGRYDSDDGSTWTILQCENARIAGNPARDRYMIDLNDSLFTRGYRVNYYFKAYDFAGKSSTLPEHADAGVYFEWTCLPTLASDVLFVDDYHGRGTMSGTVQQYWDPSLKAVLPSDNQPDRYDVNNPSSLVSNGPGSRAKNFHLTTAYSYIIWDCGNLYAGTITEGTSYSDKSNDAQMLVDWMQFSPHGVGLWVCGDDVANDLAGSPAPVALELMSAYCGVQFNNNSYHGLSGIVTPLVFADANVGNPLWHPAAWGDSFYVFGGCPIINRFDVLEKTGGGEYALRYPDIDDEQYYGGIYSVGINDGGYEIRTMWFGFSMMYLREAEPTAPMMRNQVVRDVFAWMSGDVNSDITKVDDETPAANALGQNYPNPFNPLTTIKFGLRAKGRVSIRIYDVAGRLIRTLVDEVLDAGPHEASWNGTNDRAAKVASGVYFYTMSTAEFERTRKMVLLQ